MSVKLSRRSAAELIARIHEGLKVRSELVGDDEQIYSAVTGPEGVQIICENDWETHNGKIRLTVSNVGGGGAVIVRYYDPDTLTRDYAAEGADFRARIQAINANAPVLS